MRAFDHRHQRSLDLRHEWAYEAERTHATVRVFRGGMTHPVERLHGGMVGWGGAGWLGGDASTTTVEREKNSVAIASNESFSGWTKTVTDPWLCAAIVDRLTYGGNIIETGTQSYRLAATLAHRTAG